MSEEDKSYRLEQFIKWEGGWGELFYSLTKVEKEIIFDRLKEKILNYEKDVED